jgi:regulator of protease activity HflC (stomatin/prohibitin superfamily)
MKHQIREFPAFKINGFIALSIVIALAIFGSWQVWSTIQQLLEFLGRSLRVGDFADLAEIGAWLGATLIAVVIPSLSGFLTVEPNQAIVLVFFGRYVGTIQEAGFWWTNPFTDKRKVSLRPIEIAAVIVWQVIEPAKSKFAVDDYEQFVAIQSETAIRTLAIRYPYDAPDEQSIPSLRAVPDEIALFLQKELQARLEVAGVEVLEAKLSHLAYAPEIAQMMLRRQQAKAMIDARRQIVESAVGMVDEALKRISEQQIIDLDDERKAAMINNLLVVLTSEQNIQPVINTGSLYT